MVLRTTSGHSFKLICPKIRFSHDNPNFFRLVPTNSTTPTNHQLTLANAASTEDDIRPTNTTWSAKEGTNGTKKVWVWTKVLEESYVFMH